MTDFTYAVDEAVEAGTAGLAVERRQPADLAELLERVLNTGIVIAGEIRIDLLDIELLTIKLRLVITSLDRAEEVGLDWWRADPWFSADPSPLSSGDDRALDDADDARLPEDVEQTSEAAQPSADSEAVR